MNFYGSLKKPVISLAPMEDVTDTVFRQIVCSIKKPDIMYTEFVNVNGIYSQGRDRVMQRLEYSEVERPLVVQLWGENPDHYYYASRFAYSLGFDGIDINMGCSVKKVVSKYNGSGMMIADRGLVKEIIQSVKEGAQGLPVSVKTRLGWTDYDLEWIRFLLEQDLDAITIHCRTATGFRSKKLLWTKIVPCVDLRDQMKKNTLIFGNGGIQSLIDAKKHAKRYHLDGIMIGRAAINNPWVFSDTESVSISESYEKFREHILLFERVWGQKKDFNILKKYIKSYIFGFTGSQDIRDDLLKTESIKELLSKVERLIV